MHALTRDEIARLLASAKASSERDWLMILVAFLHGLRASEVTSLRENAVADGLLTVKRLKHSLKTTQPLAESADPLFDERTALTELARKASPRARLFPVSRSTFWRIVRRHARTAGIPSKKAHPHVLKHSIAMQTIKEAGIENVRQHLGHKSISSTGMYLRVTDEDASKAVARALDLAKKR
jgi:type 1 fimbriae regulatory protein FimB